MYSLARIDRWRLRDDAPGNEGWRMANVVVITGSSSGLGLLSALAFARQGDRVYATMRDPTKSDELRENTRHEGLNVTVSKLDVTVAASVVESVDRVLDAEGRIDVLVNNAGVLTLSPLEVLTDEVLRSTFETNFFGAVRMIRAVLPTMRAHRSGVIINVSSLSGRLPGGPIYWPYAASKHALSTMSDGLAMEVEPFGIKVACIEPGFFRTDILTKANLQASRDSPYQEVGSSVLRYFERGLAQGADPQHAVDAIVAATKSDDPDLIHVLVGEDSQQFIQAYRTMSEPDYKAELRAALGL